MRLTPILCGFIRRTRIKGKLDSGKVQEYKPVTYAMKKRAAEQLVMEQRNAELLARPFISLAEEESYREDPEVRAEIQAKVDADMQKQREDRWIEGYTTAEHLGHLNTSKQWE